MLGAPATFADDLKVIAADQVPEMAFAPDTLTGLGHI
jgi:hypothetical protein